MILNVIILALMLFLIYLNKDRVLALFKNKGFEQHKVGDKSYGVITKLETLSDYVGKHFLTSNMKVSVSNLSRKEVTMHNIKFYINVVDKSNYGFNDHQELFVIDESKIKKMGLTIPQSRNTGQKFYEEFNIYVNEDLSFNYTLHCNALSLILENFGVNSLTIKEFMYFISAEIEMVDGTISYSNKIPLQIIVDDISLIASFKIDEIVSVMDRVEEKDKLEREKRLNGRRRNGPIEFDGNIDNFLDTLNNRDGNWTNDDGENFTIIDDNNDIEDD